MEQAKRNLLALKENPYPGRGFVIGMNETGDYLVQLYFLMGRSTNSRNRVFIVEDNGVLKTAPADPSKVEDPSLIIYQAMAEDDGKYVVSNGHQTIDALSATGLIKAMEKWTYEPDSPNYTPRITAVLDLKGAVKISILKKVAADMSCIRLVYNLVITTPGLGYCVTTYSGDGNPLPSFAGAPYLLPLLGDFSTLIRTIWDALNEENRVSLALKTINIQTGESSIGVINKYQAIG